MTPRSIDRRRLHRWIAVAMAMVGVMLAATGSASGKGGPQPQLGRSVVAEPVGRGRISVKPPGGRTRRLSAARAIPLGSVLNATDGTVRVINATNAAGATQSAEFSHGAIRVRAPIAARGELVVDLIDPPCGPAQAASLLRSSSKHVSTKAGHRPGVQVNGGSGHGRSGRGAYASADAASVREVTWNTVDTCAGGQITTTIVDHLGEVGTTGAHGVPVRFALSPGAQIAYQCGAAPPASEAYCALVRTHVATPALALTLVTRHRKRTHPPYVLDLSPPNNFPDSKVSLPLRPVPGGFGRSDVACGADQGPGEYEITWSVENSILAVIEVRVPRGVENTGAVNVPCAARPFGPWVPADLLEHKAAGTVVVHYTDRPASFSDYTTSAVAKEVAREANLALTFDTQTLGMPVAPASDAPLNVYLDESMLLHGFHVYQVPERSVPDAVGRPFWPLGEPGPAYVVLNPSVTVDPFYIDFGVFEALADETVGPLYTSGNYTALESAASWAAFSQTQAPFSNWIPYLDQPIDCNPTCVPLHNTYNQWRLFEYLAEQYGPGIVGEILSRDAAALRAPTQTPALDRALDSVLGAHRTTLAATLAAYALTDLSDGWKQPWFGHGGLSPGPNQTVALQAAGDSFPAQTFGVQRLAIDYLRVDVPPRRQQPCASEILTVDVAVPAGGIVPGGATVVHGVSGTVPASSPAPGTSQVQVPVDGCTGVTLRVPFVNGTTGNAPLIFSATGTLAAASAG